MAGFDVRTTVALASGAALVFLGAVVFVPRPRRAATLLFAAFAVCWGAQVMAANLARATDRASWLWWSLALVPATTVYLAGVVMAYPTRWRGPAGRTFLGAATALAAGAVVAMALAPDLVFRGFGASSEGAPARFGALAPLLFAAPFYLAFAVAAVRLVAVWRGGGVGAAQARWLAAGLLLFASYMPVRNLRGLATRPAYAAGLDAAVRLSFEAVFVLGIGAAAIAVVLAVVPGRGRRPDALLAACGAVPMAVAAAEWVLLAAGRPEFETLGAWRLGAVAVMAYGIARYQVFDLDLRVKWTLSRGAVAALVAGGFLLGAEWLEGFVPFDNRALGVATAGAIAAAMRPLHRWAERGVDRLLPHVRPTGAYVHRRKLEVYGLALARAGGAGDPVLADLRTALGLSPRDHAAALRGLGGPRPTGPRRRA